MRQIIFACLCIVSFVFFEFNSDAQLSDAQLHKVDSLKRVVHTSDNDSIRLMTLLKWINVIYDYEQEECLALNEWAVAICDSNLSKDLSEVHRNFYTKRRGNCIHNIGITYYYAANYEKALEYFNLSLLVQIQKKDTLAISSGLNNIGLVYVQLGNLPKSLEYNNQALSLRIVVDDSAGIAQSFANMGSIYSDLGDYKKAVEFDWKSMRIYELIGDSSGVAMNCTNLGNIYERTKEYERAKLYYNRSLEIQKLVGSRLDYALLLSNIGSVLSRQKKFTEAEKYLNESLLIRVEHDDKLGMANGYNNLSAVKRAQGNYEAAIELSLKSAQISRDIRMPFQLKSALQSLVYYFAAAGNPEQAAKCGSEVIQLNSKAIQTNFILLSEKEKEFYFATLAADYGTYYSFVLKYKEQIPSLTENVFNTCLTNKGLLLKSSTAMRQAILTSGDDELIEKYGEWIDLKKKIARQFGQGIDLQKLEIQADSLEHFLVRESYFFSQLEKARELTWKDVQSGLKPNEAAIEFVHFKKEIFTSADSGAQTVYCALIVKSTSEYPEMVELFSEQELLNLIGNFQGNNLKYIEKIYGSKTETQDSLYKLIWKPLDATLKGFKRIYYSPSGLLHKISFAALRVDSDLFLCDSYELVHTSSSGILAMNEQFNIDGDMSVSIFGGIDYDTDCTRVKTWNYLEGTMSEGTSIATYLNRKGQAVNYFHGQDATEEKFKKIAESSSVIHVATHGFFFPELTDTDMLFESTENSSDILFRGGHRAIGYDMFLENNNPLMRSGLVLAGANDVWNLTESSASEDGVLTAEEVIHLDLRSTGLVVLSACETGLGEVHDSEGVYGLQRAFKMAGVKFIIMSLWQVPDKETAEFMITFYQQLSKFKDVRLAFSKTQLMMRKKYDPYYWAAFTLLQ